MAKIKKSVQGTYIAINLKEVLETEADKLNTTPTRLASSILEQGIKTLIKKEKKDEDK